MNPPTSTCDALYRKSSDPWGFRTRWYEKRKREILVASLIQPRFENCWELGCSNGELTAALAPRCDRILATDGNRVAIDEARRRLTGFPHVQVEHQIHPRDWPHARFDLIIFSELGYNFDEETLRLIVTRMESSLLPAGNLIACHWRHPIEGCALRGDDAHAILGEMLQLTRLVHHLEADFILEVWSSDPRSVAAREGMA